MIIIIYFFHCIIGEQHTNPELVAINPNHTLPAMEDNGYTMFERCRFIDLGLIVFKDFLSLICLMHYGNNYVALP